jgi:hypothetical protein
LLGASFFDANLTGTLATFMMYMEEDVNCKSRSTVDIVDIFSDRQNLQVLILRMLTSEVLIYH